MSDEGGGEIVQKVGVIDAQDENTSTPNAAKQGACRRAQQTVLPVDAGLGQRDDTLKCAEGDGDRSLNAGNPGCGSANGAGNGERLPSQTSLADTLSSRKDQPAGSVGSHCGYDGCELALTADEGPGASLHSQALACPRCFSSLV
jgi:hypothetical protein